jgi:hypothetical protein
MFNKSKQTFPKNYVPQTQLILKLFVPVGRWYTSKCVKKKNQ